MSQRRGFCLKVAVSQGQVVSGNAPHYEEEKKQLLLRELNQILESRFFRNAERCKEFLQYVVHHRLEHSGPLKERTIGIEIFHRSHDYATGEDPVVRVQAGEVRRRLEQYYKTATSASSLRIDLPVGSYSPVFSEVHPQPSAAELSHEPSAPKPAIPSGKNRRRYPLVAAGLTVLLVAGAIALESRHYRGIQKTAIDDFWSPVFATQQPVLVCLAKATVYRPTQALFERYARTHAGAFQATIEKYDRVLPIDPKEKIFWAELREDPAFGVARGDAYAAVTLSALLGEMGKPDQIRIGSDYSFSDLKNSPSVIVGAFNNRWTLQITSGLHFAFVDQQGRTMIREQASPSRTWEEHYRDNNNLFPIEDAAIVARLLDSGTGQFTIVVAGVGELGTQAASELVTRADLLEQAIRGLPSGWQKRNLEIVLQTTVTDSVPGPPHVVATYTW